MDMLKGEQIAEANLTDWRKLAQGLHARYLVDDFGTGARFVAAVGEAGDALGHHPRVSIGNGYVDLKLVTDDAIYRDDEGTEHVVEWVTQQDVDLARRITEIAADHKVDADPASVGDIELGLDTARSATIAPVWAALLTGSAEAQGRGSPSDEIRDATGRVPNLWFGDADEHETPRQRFHIEVYVAPEVAEQRIAAALAAGGTIVDDSKAPSLTVIAPEARQTFGLRVSLLVSPPERPFRTAKPILSHLRRFGSILGRSAMTASTRAAMNSRQPARTSGRSPAAPATCAKSTLRRAPS
jgi:4a-hydroxytetrahydrobiopterin dehydratase